MPCSVFKIEGKIKLNRYYTVYGNLPGQGPDSRSKNEKGNRNHLVYPLTFLHSGSAFEKYLPHALLQSREGNGEKEMVSCLQVALCFINKGSEIQKSYMPCPKIQSSKPRTQLSDS